MQKAVANRKIWRQLFKHFIVIMLIFIFNVNVINYCLTKYLNKAIIKVWSTFFLIIWLKSCAKP